MVIVRGPPEGLMMLEAVAATTLTPPVPDALGSEDFGFGEAAKLTEVGRTRLAISPIVPGSRALADHASRFPPLSG